METSLQCLKTIACDQGAIRAVRFNVDGSYCLTCGSDKKLKLWNPHKGVFLKVYGGHAGDVFDACGSSDSSQIISCGADKSVILWDVATGQTVRRYRGHAGAVNCVKFNEDSSVAVSGGQDNTIIFWDVKGRSFDPIQVLKDAKDGVTSINVVENQIVASSLDCSVRCYDIRSGKITKDFIGEPVTYASLTRDAQGMLVSTSDDTIRLFDRSSGELLAEFSGHCTKDYKIENCVNTKDDRIMSGSTDGFIYCWDLVSQKLVGRLAHSEGHVVHSIAAHPTKEYYLSACRGDVFMWGEKLENDDEEEDDS